jgi:hypothetical protein
MSTQRPEMGWPEAVYNILKGLGGFLIFVIVMLSFCGTDGVVKLYQGITHPIPVVCTPNK